MYINQNNTSNVSIFSPNMDYKTIFEKSEDISKFIFHQFECETEDEWIDPKYFRPSETVTSIRSSSVRPNDFLDDHSEQEFMTTVITFKLTKDHTGPKPEFKVTPPVRDYYKPSYTTLELQSVDKIKMIKRVRCQIGYLEPVWSKELNTYVSPLKLETHDCDKMLPVYWGSVLGEPFEEEVKDGYISAGSKGSKATIVLLNRDLVKPENEAALYRFMIEYATSR